MNERFLAFVGLGKTLAADAGLEWEFELDEHGKARDGVGWNLTQASGTVATSNRYLRDFGPDAKAFQRLCDLREMQGLDRLDRRPMSEAWRHLLLSAVAEQLLFKRNTVEHTINNVARPLQVLATCVTCEPWLLTGNDVRFAIDVARMIQPSGLLASCLVMQIKSLFDGQHICDAGPLYPTLASEKYFVEQRSRKARHRLSPSELQQTLEERKRGERLPDRKAFWELVRIVFTERPKSFGDSLRFAACRILLLTGLRAGEVALLPHDWRRERAYVDSKGRKAGDSGGYSTALMLRHFPEKQQEEQSNSRTIREGLQPVPEMFRAILSETLDQVSRLTAPLRATLKLQCESNRLLPWYPEDHLLPIHEAYVRLMGNAFWLDIDREPFIERYQSNFDPETLSDLRRHQVEQRSQVAYVRAFYQFGHRLKTLIAEGKTSLVFRDADGTPLSDIRLMTWHSVYLKVGEVEQYVRDFTPTKVSDLASTPCEGGKAIQPWEFLFLFPKRALAEERNDGICDIERYIAVNMPDPSFIQITFGDAPSRPGLLGRYGKSAEDRKLKLSSHELRHLQNTELFRMGLADTIISKRFNRRSVAQSYEYDHRSLAESLADIDLPDDVEASMSPRAATVAKLVKADKVSGPIVDAFRRIQQDSGDAEAYDYLRVEADGFHCTPYGYCVNSFTVDPCPKHLECFDGCRHLAATGLPEHHNNLIGLESKLLQAMEAIQVRKSKSPGWKNQLAHVEVRLRGVRKLISTPTGHAPFPDGADLSANAPRGVIDD